MIINVQHKEVKTPKACELQEKGGYKGYILFI